MKQERIKIPMSSEDILELWNLLYFKNSTTEFNGETYTHIMQINTSDKSDGESWDYIIQRKSDDKFFKFHIWDAGSHNGFLAETEYLKEVFPIIVTTYE